MHARLEGRGNNANSHTECICHVVDTGSAGQDLIGTICKLYEDDIIKEPNDIEPKVQLTYRSSDLNTQQHDFRHVEPEVGSGLIEADFCSRDLKYVYKKTK